MINIYELLHWKSNVFLNWYLKANLQGGLASSHGWGYLAESRYFGHLALVWRSVEETVAGSSLTPSQPVCASPCSWRMLGKAYLAPLHVCSTNAWFGAWLGTSLGTCEVDAELCMAVAVWDACKGQRSGLQSTSWGQGGHEKRWWLCSM